MKNIFVLSLICLLTACTSNYKKVQNQMLEIERTADPAIKLKRLERRQSEVCQDYSEDYECAKISASIAAISAYMTQQYPLAVKNAELAYLKHTSKTNTPMNASKKRDEVCNYTYASSVFRSSGISAAEAKNLPSSFSMVYFTALKGANDPRAKGYLNTAFLCELAFPLYKKPEEIIEQYLQNSKKLHDMKNQKYVNTFINDIYTPIQKAQLKFTKDGTNTNQQLSSAKHFLLYRNALAYAKKIGLPQAYQDYLSYYVYLFDRNKS